MAFLLLFFFGCSVQNLAWPARDRVFNTTSELLPKALPQKEHVELLKGFTTSEFLAVCWTCALPSARPPAQKTASHCSGAHEGLSRAVTNSEYALDG